MKYVWPSGLEAGRASWFQMNFDFLTLIVVWPSSGFCPLTKCDILISVPLSTADGRPLSYVTTLQLFSLLRSSLLLFSSSDRLCTIPAWQQCDNVSSAQPHWYHSHAGAIWFPDTYNHHHRHRSDRLNRSSLLHFT